MAQFNTRINDDLDMLREATRRFADAEIAPIAAQVDEENLFPQALWQRMGEMGLLGMTVPEEYGGSDLGYLAHVVAMEEISRGSGAIGLSYGAHSNLCLNNVYHNGNEEQRELIREAIIEGGLDNMSDIQAVIEATGALEYTAQRARSASDAAIAALQRLPDNPYSQALKSLAEFAIQRRS